METEDHAFSRTRGVTTEDYSLATWGPRTMLTNITFASPQEDEAAGMRSMAIDRRLIEWAGNYALPSAASG